MKKIILAVALTGMIAVAGVQAASADSGYGYGYCGSYGSGEGIWGAGNSKAAEKYLEETAGLRKEVAVKEATLAAILRQQNPDEKKVAQLSGELFDLRTELGSKAEERNLPTTYAGLHHRGNGWHMMGW